MRHPEWTDREVALIKAMIGCKFFLREIAAAFGEQKQFVRARLIRLGIPVPNKTEALKKDRKPRPHPDMPGVWLVPTDREVSALVDEADVDLVSGFLWRATPARNNARGIYYVSTSANNRVLLLHRVILNAPASMTVDHINGDPLDNRRSNLRLATLSQNCTNKHTCRARSGYRGVQLQKSGQVHGKPWAAVICHDNRTRYIGRYKTAEEAARARDAESVRVHGEFARLNFPAEWGRSH